MCVKFESSGKHSESASSISRWTPWGKTKCAKDDAQFVNNIPPLFFLLIFMDTDVYKQLTKDNVHFLHFVSSRLLFFFLTNHVSNVLKIYLRSPLQLIWVEGCRQQVNTCRSQITDFLQLFPRLATYILDAVFYIWFMETWIKMNSDQKKPPYCVNTCSLYLLCRYCNWE